MVSVSKFTLIAPLEPAINSKFLHSSKISFPNKRFDFKLIYSINLIRTIIQRNIFQRWTYNRVHSNIINEIILKKLATIIIS